MSDHRTEKFIETCTLDRDVLIRIDQIVAVTSVSTHVSGEICWPDRAVVTLASGKEIIVEESYDSIKGQLMAAEGSPS